MGGDRVAKLAALALSLTARVAVADVEAVRVEVHAPPLCSDRGQFWREVQLRTSRVRLAAADEPSRRALVVLLQPGGRAMEGELVLSDSSGPTTRRRLSGESCEGVVSSLALVAALALDPRASTGSIPGAPPLLPAPSPIPPPPPPPLPPPPPPAPMPPRQAPAPVIASPVIASPAPAPDPGPVPVQSARPPSRWRVATGLHAGILGFDAPGLVADGELFGDLTLERPGLVSPSFRLAVHRSLEATLEGEAGDNVGTGTFAWTFGRAEVCPLRIGLSSTFAVRPCALLDVGVIRADGKVNSVETSSETQLWGTAGGLARLEWLRKLSRGWALLLELDGGAVAPLLRETFYFKPATTVYTAPAAAAVASFGAGVRFP